MLSAFILAVILTADGARPVEAAAPVSSQCELCGTWILVDRIDRTTSGEVVPEPGLGQDPRGILVYDHAGNVAVQLMKRDRGPKTGTVVNQPSGNRNNSGTGDGYDAYFGKYDVDRSRHTVTHRIEGGVAPTDIGKALTRNYVLAGDELDLSFDTSNAGVPVRRTLRWRRAA